MESLLALHGMKVHPLGQDTVKLPVPLVLLKVLKVPSDAEPQEL